MRPMTPGSEPAARLRPQPIHHHAPSADELARGRRLMAIIVLTVCTCLFTMMVLWSNAAPVT
jgi:hypothetical protein